MTGDMTGDMIGAGKRAQEHIRAYESEQSLQRRSGFLLAAVMIGQLACLVGLIDGIALIVRHRLLVGLATAAVSVALSALLYLAYFVATAVLRKRSASPG